MKENNIYSVIFIENADFGQFEITTDINKSVKDYLIGYINFSEKDKDELYSSFKMFKNHYEDYDNNPDKYNNFWVYYKKDFKTLKAAEKHIKFFESILDDHIAPIYNVVCCGFREYLESTNYWKE